MHRLLIGNDRNLKRRAYIWNIVGSLIAALTSVFLLFAVSRISGATQAGIFTLAFSTAQMMLTIGLYEMRPYQATDVEEIYPFSDYLISRAVTCTLMIAASAVFVFAGGYTQEKGMVILLICVFKMFDALEDVFHGLYQQRGRLDVAGKSLALRMGTSMAAFIVTLYLTNDLIFTCWVSIAAAAVGFALFNLTIFRSFYQGKFHFCGKALRKLLWACLPLFLSSFMLIFVNNAPKYAIDAYIPSEAFQAYYGYIFMPAFVINLFGTFLFKPMVTPMADQWVLGNKKELLRMILKLAGAIVVLTVVLEAACYFIGIPLLSWFYAADLSAYRAELMVLVLGGGFNALVSLMFYSITVIRKQRYVVIGYGAALIFALAASNLLVPHAGLMGASLAYLLSMAVLVVIFACIFGVCFKKGHYTPAEESK
ncbi:MAG: hypothetical protein VB082_08055 [Christensenella sp.]|nr:hypothetical protein [Christensenella sp.]